MSEAENTWTPRKVNYAYVVDETTTLSSLVTTPVYDNIIMQRVSASNATTFAQPISVVIAIDYSIIQWRENL
jgi:hypothetical protein